MQAGRTYRVVVFSGVALLFAVPPAAQILLGGQAVLPAFAASVTVFFIALEAFWFRRLVFAAEQKPHAVHEGPEGDGEASVPGVQALASPTTLAEALALSGGDADALAAAGRGGRRAVGEFLFWQAMIVVAVLAGFWAIAVFEVETVAGVPAGALWPVAVLAPAAILAVRLLGPRSILASAIESGQEQHLRPLGLELVELPSVRLLQTGGGVRAVGKGQAVAAGVRRGHHVEITQGAGDSLVAVAVAAPEFRLEAPEGKLEPVGEVPAAVERALRGLRKAKRWQSLELEGGPEGLVAYRRRPRTENHWLYDLWLCERIADELERQA